MIFRNSWPAPGRDTSTHKGAWSSGTSSRQVRVPEKEGSPVQRKQAGAASTQREARSGREGWGGSRGVAVVVPVRGLKMKMAPLMGLVVRLPSNVLWMVTRYTLVSSTNQMIWLLNSSP